MAAEVSVLKHFKIECQMIIGGLIIVEAEDAEMAMWTLDAEFGDALEKGVSPLDIINDKFAGSTRLEWAGAVESLGIVKGDAVVRDVKAAHAKEAPGARRGRQRGDVPEMVKKPKPGTPEAKALKEKADAKEAKKKAVQSAVKARNPRGEADTKPAQPVKEAKPKVAATKGFKPGAAANKGVAAVKVTARKGRTRG